MHFWKKSPISSAEEEQRWDRWRAIFDVLEDQQVASAAELLEASGGKEALLEKDLDTLCSAGLIRRTARGGVALEAYHAEKPLEERIAENREGKLRIARLVVEKYLHPGMTVGIDASTTVKAIAPFIRDMKLCVVTNCLSLIAELRDLEFAGEIQCSGGNYRAMSNSLVGPEACHFIAGRQIDLALLGTDGISSHLEIMEAHPDEALFKRALIRHAKRTLVLALPEKFRDTSLLPVASLSAVEAIISTSFPNEEFVVAAKGTGVRLECPGG